MTVDTFPQNNIALLSFTKTNFQLNNSNKLMVINAVNFEKSSGIKIPTENAVLLDDTLQDLINRMEFIRNKHEISFDKIKTVTFTHEFYIEQGKKQEQRTLFYTEFPADKMKELEDYLGFTVTALKTAVKVMYATKPCPEAPCF